MQRFVVHLPRAALVGALCVVMVLMSIGGPPPRSVAQEPTSTPFGTIPEQVCPDAPLLKLRPGLTAQIVALADETLPGAPLLTDPDLTSFIKRYLPLKATASVVSPPQCVEGQQMWFVQVAPGLNGWLAETSGDRVLLEPFSGEPPPLTATTALQPLNCVRIGESTPPVPGSALTRIAYAGADGTLYVADNGGAGRPLAQFDFPPTSVALSPDGAAVAVTNQNGLYWIPVEAGDPLLLTDGAPLDMRGRARVLRAYWLPGGRALALEVQDTNGESPVYQIWSFPGDGSATFRVDIGAQPPNSVRLSPPGNRMIVIAANDISPFPANISDDANPLLEFVPVNEDDSADAIYVPAITWSADGLGFYTYIPAGPLTPPDDPIARHLIYVPLEGKYKDLGIPGNVVPGEYVIPSPDGKTLLLGFAASWRIQAADTGRVLVQIPQLQFLFDWTPDGKGTVFTYPNGIAGYYGLDAATTSPYVPAQVTGLYGIRWLNDGTILFLTRDENGKLFLNAQLPGKDKLELGELSALDAYSAAILPGAPAPVVVPQPCN